MTACTCRPHQINTGDLVALCGECGGVSAIVDASCFPCGVAAHEAVVGEADVVVAPVATKPLKECKVGDRVRAPWMPEGATIRELCRGYVVYDDGTHDRDTHEVEVVEGDE